MTVDTTLIRVRSDVRDRVRVLADRDHVTFSQVISDALDSVERQQFWDKVAALTPDETYRQEFADWSAADLVSEDVERSD
ncbi:MAG: hypothetical protein FWF43_03515 [Propionibacteriaceae bacterium]|nr:hypothetical protein [Propionibacteriaceae bacterium]